MTSTHSPTQDLYQDTYGDFKSTDIIDSLTVSELVELLDLFSDLFDSKTSVKSAGNSFSVSFDSDARCTFHIRSPDPRWSYEEPTDKFYIRAALTPRNNFSYEQINELNLENLDLKFVIHKDNSGNEFICVDRLYSVEGGVTVLALIMLINEVIVSITTLRKALNKQVR